MNFSRNNKRIINKNHSSKNCSLCALNSVTDIFQLIYDCECNVTRLNRETQIHLWIPSEWRLLPQLKSSLVSLKRRLFIRTESLARKAARCIVPSLRRSEAREITNEIRTIAANMLTQFKSRSIVNGRQCVGRGVRQHAEEGEDSEQLHDWSVSVVWFVTMMPPSVSMITLYREDPTSLWPLPSRGRLSCGRSLATGIPVSLSSAERCPDVRVRILISGFIAVTGATGTRAEAINRFDRWRKSHRSKARPDRRTFVWISARSRCVVWNIWHARFRKQSMTEK